MRKTPKTAEFEFDFEFELTVELTYSRTEREFVFVSDLLCGFDFSRSCVRLSAPWFCARCIRWLPRLERKRAVVRDPSANLDRPTDN